MGRTAMHGCASVTLIKDATYRVGWGRCAAHNIIEFYTYYDKFVADGSKELHSNKNCTS